MITNLNEWANLVDHRHSLGLIEKYKGIAALPLDIPQIYPDSWDRFWEIWKEEQERVKRQNIDRGAAGADKPSLEYTQWVGLSVYEIPELYSHGAWATKISQQLIDTNPNMIEKMFSLLPFVKIRSIRFWSSIVPINAHRDDNMPRTLNNILKFPSEIRIMIADNNPQETFWVTDATKTKSQQKDGVEKHYVKLPNDSNTFIWNNENYLHGADYDPQYHKILAVIRGWVDVHKLEKLIDQSIEKYPEYVIRI